MVITTDRRNSAAAQTRAAVDEVLRIAQANRGRATVAGGSKPHVTLTCSVTDYSDGYFRAMLSGIEYATRGHFAPGAQAIGGMVWTLRSRLIDVSVRASKENT